MLYDLPLYRPPSEANSLIIQLTTGCAHNQCQFCTMYKEKGFKIKPLQEVMAMLDNEKHLYQNSKRVFLADGDALVLPVEYLLTLLEYIQKEFKQVERVSTYATPQDILRKSATELMHLKSYGLSMAYMGIESGSDQVLQKMRKGADAADIIAAGQKMKEAGWILSTTAISGLGGKEWMTQHAIETAKVVKAIQPDYFSLLALMVEPHSKLHQWVQKGKFHLLSCKEILLETQLMLENLDQTATIFRNNHASNYFSFNGRLPHEREKILAEIKTVLADDEYIKYIEKSTWRSL